MGTKGSKLIGILMPTLCSQNKEIPSNAGHPTTGGWSTFPTFSRDELQLAVSHMEMMSREFDSINFEGLIELLGHCTYTNSFMDMHDRTLLETLLNNCINEKAVSSNRYR